MQIQFSTNEKLNRWETDVILTGRAVKLHVDLSVPEANLNGVASAAIAKIEENTVRIQQNIVDSLLETYNDCWSDPDDPGLPEMDAETFLSKITLDSVNVDDDAGINLYFTDSNLFGGHTVDVLWLADDKMYDASLQG